MWKDQVSIENFFSKSNITSDWKRKIEIKLFIQIANASGSCLMGIICIHVMIYFLECTAASVKHKCYSLITMIYFLNSECYILDQNQIQRLIQRGGDKMAMDAPSAPKGPSKLGQAPSILSKSTPNLDQNALDWIKYPRFFLGRPILKFLHQPSYLTFKAVPFWRSMSF